MAARRTVQLSQDDDAADNNGEKWTDRITTTTSTALQCNSSVALTYHRYHPYSCLHALVTVVTVDVKLYRREIIIVAGITGTVSIDANGDRNGDYSLLDMNSTTGRFQVSASLQFHTQIDDNTDRI